MRGPWFIDPEPGHPLYPPIIFSLPGLAALVDKEAGSSSALVQVFSYLVQVLPLLGSSSVPVERAAGLGEEGRRERLADWLLRGG